MNVYPFACDIRKKPALVQIVSDRAYGQISVIINERLIGKTYQHSSFIDERVEFL